MRKTGWLTYFVTERRTRFLGHAGTVTMLPCIFARVKELVFGLRITNICYRPVFKRQSSVLPRIFYQFLGNSRTLLVDWSRSYDSSSALKPKTGPEYQTLYNSTLKKNTTSKNYPRKGERREKQQGTQHDQKAAKEWLFGVYGSSRPYILYMWSNNWLYRAEPF